jgi:hypothetical protein
MQEAAAVVEFNGGLPASVRIALVNLGGRPAEKILRQGRGEIQPEVLDRTHDRESRHTYPIRGYRKTKLSLAVQPAPHPATNAAKRQKVTAIYCSRDSPWASPFTRLASAQLGKVAPRLIEGELYLRAPI